MSNFLKNLHPLLRRKKNPKDNEDVNYALIKVLNEEMNMIEKDAIESKLQSSLKSSTGDYLDNFGDWFGVYRKKDEEDEKYRARIIKYLLLKRGTNNAIIEAIKDYLEDSDADVSIYEPFRNIFYTNKSHLNGNDHLMGYYYNFAIINVSVGSYFPMEIVDVINEFKPAGVKFYVTYDGGGTNTGSSIIKVLDNPVNIDVYQNIDRLSGYSETFYGHINMGLRKVSYDSETDIFKTNRSKINSNDVLTGSSSIGRAFHNYAYKTNYVYNPTRTSTVSEIKTVLDEKGRELPLEYYINTTEKGRQPVTIDVNSTTGTAFIYNNLNLREYFSHYKPELLQGDSQEIKNAISSYMGTSTFDLFMEALISPEETINVQTQVFDFSIGRWVTVKNSKITYGMQNVGAELGYVKDYMNNELNMFTRVSIASSSDVTVNINYLDLLFYHYTADVYTVKPYKGLIEYYIELDRLSYVDAFKVASLNNGDIISKLGYEPMGYVRVVGESNEPKEITQVEDFPETTNPSYDFLLLNDTNDLAKTKHTRYLIEFDITGTDRDKVTDLYITPTLALEDLSDTEVLYDYVTKVSLTGTKGRAIIEIPRDVDLEQYPYLAVFLSSYDTLAKENLRPGENLYANSYKIGFSNVTIQDIYESTDQAPDPSTKTNRAFTDTRTIDATPGRGNSAQDGNILGNEAYSLKAPANYDNSKYEILTDLSLRKPIETGKTYTIQLKGKLGSDRPYWYVYNSNGSFNELYGQSPLTPDNYDPKTGIYTKTFVAPPEDYEHLGVNLLKPYEGEPEIEKSILTTKEFEFAGWGNTIYKGTYISNVTEPGKKYTLSFDMEISKLSNEKLNQKLYGIRLYDRDKRKDAIVARYDLPREIGQKKSVSVTFTMPEGNYDIIGYSSVLTPDGTLDSFPRDFDELKITNLKLELGNQKTPWSEAPDVLPGKHRKRLNRNIRIYQAPNTGTSKSTIEWVKIEEGAQATPAGYNFGYYTLAENLPKGNYDIYYKAKIDILEGNPDMLTIVDYPNTVLIIDPKFLVPIEDGYVKGKISVNRTDTEGRLLIYAGLAGATAGNKIRFSELEVYYSTDTIEYVENEIILKDSSGNILPAEKVYTDYTTPNSVYNGQKTYNHSVMLHGSYTNIAEIEFKGKGKVDNLKLQYTRYPIPSSWNTLYEADTIEPNPDSFSLKYDNELRDLYGLELIDYSRLNAFSLVKLQSLWDTTIEEITSSTGSFTDMPDSYFNATWQYIDRLDEVTIGSMSILDDIAGGMIDNSIQTVTVRRKPTISQYTDTDNNSVVEPQYTEDITIGSPRRLYELKELTMAEETIEIDNSIRVIDIHSEQVPNTSIIKGGFQTKQVAGSQYVSYELYEPVQEGQRYEIIVRGDFKDSLEFVSLYNSNPNFNETFLNPTDVVDGIATKEFIARKATADKPRPNTDVRLYIRPYTADPSTIYSVELRKL